MAAGEAFRKIVVVEGDAAAAADLFDVGDVLKQSIQSIIGDDTLSKADKAAMLDKTTAQFVNYLGVPVTTDKGRQLEKDRTMDISGYSSVIDVIRKTHNGVCIFAKQELASDGPPLLTEREATQLCTEHFKVYRPGTPDRAFAAGIASSAEGPLLMRWIQSCRNNDFRKAAYPELASSPRFDAQPRQVGGDDAFDSINDPRPALDQLNELAAEVREKHPFMTPAQAFARVYQDRANADLVAQERGENRPGGANIRERVSGAEVASSSSPARQNHSRGGSSPGRP
jgi:hypothetical protein